MGSGRWNDKKWDAYAGQNINTRSATTGSRGVFQSNRLKSDLDPRNLKDGYRESRDSVDNPASTPIIIGLDVTGSMNRLSDQMARNGLPTLAKEIYNRVPVSDPHLMFAGIGDGFTDTTPLQVTQFEADIRIAEQLTDIYLENGGGGNGSEGYALAWYFAAKHTQIDSYAKRGKKGFIFTIGDDGPTPFIPKEQIKRIFGDTVEADLKGEEVLNMVLREWEVYHITLAEGGTGDQGVQKQWENILGERAIMLKDHKKVGEVIVSILQVMNGVAVDDVVNSWDGTTKLVIADTLAGSQLANRSSQQGLVEF